VRARAGGYKDPVAAVPANTNEVDLQSARAGDRQAFERLVQPHMDRLRALTYRVLGHPEDAADVVQETLLRAFRQLDGFRGEASFSTWLSHIATNLCLDMLRSRGRWRVEAQPMAKDDCLEQKSPLHGELESTMSDASFVFDVHEHIAFCFTCVARTLDPHMEVALVLCDVFGLGNGEAAALIGVTEAVHRHRLAAARAQMQSAFDGLCALVNKSGVCYQCAELRDSSPASRRGPEVPALGGTGDPPEERWKLRLSVVKDADLAGGRSRPLHDLLFRWIGANARAEGARSET
jgi:RNA polymerase sigma-70 factor (ECF subfamily)